ncbi:MAG: hypothetical protein AB7P12_19835 [Alphaproteobacteria bacterium]
MLRAPLRVGAFRAQKGVGRSIPAPVGGWDASTPLANMGAEFAVRLDNWDPEPGYVKLRRGFGEHATGVGAGVVESLMAYHGVATSDDALFAASASDIYEVTASGAAGAAVVTSLGNGRWQHVNFTTSGGHFLIIVNGADSLRAFDGSNWSTPSITGLTSSDFVHVTAHKRRLWFVLNGSTKAGYLPVDSIAGAATAFELGAVFSKGGYLQAIGSWTLDSGTGIDDLAVFISSKGQVAVYSGTDPSSADSWSLIGVFDLGPPIGRRCLTKVGGDLALITIDGVIPLSTALSLDRAAVNNVAITARIQSAMNSAARDYGGHFGWQLLAYPKGTKAVLNVPVAESVTAHQYVMNTLTGAWCRYTGINANCWEIFQDRLLFGGASGTIFEADIGALDHTEPIHADLVSAFNYYGAPGRLKQWTMIQPLIVADGRVTPKLYVDTDFKVTEAAATVSEIMASGAEWDEAVWDADEWAEAEVVVNDWAGLSALGQAGAVHMIIDVAVPEESAGNDVLLRVSGFNVIFEPAGFF